MIAVAASVAALLLSSSRAEAQDVRAAARDVVKKWQDAIVNVRVVLKTRMSMGGREMQSADDSVDAVGTVIDPSGLTVMSLGSLNPGAMMSKIVGVSTRQRRYARRHHERADRPQDPAARRPGAAAKIVLRDEDLDLAFIRPTTKPAAPLVAINLAESATPALLEQVRGAVAARVASAAGPRRPRWPTSAR